MDEKIKDLMLALLQVEAQHRQRIDSIWTQFKDAMLVMHGAIFTILGSLLTVPALKGDDRFIVIAFTVLLDLVFVVAARLDVEKSAAEVQADYAADYRALTGVEPPRLLYSRALKMRKERRRREGATIVPPGDVDDTKTDA